MGRAVLTLGITTSTSVMGVAVGDDRVRAEQVESTDRRHAERLLPLALEVLERAGSGLHDVERLAIDTGPGLFTGLRVGLATIGGLARALDRPVVTASSLFLIAAGWGHAGSVLAVIDARRGEVFAQPFRIDGPAVVPLAGPEVLDPAAAVERAAGAPAVGDGAERYREQFEAAGVVVHPGPPSAAELVRRAGSLPVSPSRIPAPTYLREPDARVGVWATRTS
jgi:tRNA threonylcarbamoyladenosine biosynthesis protein TsaB